MQFNLFRKIIFTLLCLGIITSIGLNRAWAASSKGSLIFIPLDNRPVCYTYPVDVLQAAGYKVYTPPEKLLASRTGPANVDGLWKWLENRAEKSRAAVISTDALIYGGLVASRTHHYTPEQLEARVKRLKDLHMDTSIKFYAFSTLMRTPEQSFGAVEPDYYSKIGPAIYQYSQLVDKTDIKLETILESLKLNAIERNTAKAYLEDWLSRRTKNMEVNHQLALMSRMGRFNYFAIGKDDNAPLSHTHMEARKLFQANMDVSDRDFQILPGVDQLGLLLLTRAVNEFNNTSPKVYQLYVEGEGPKTIPQYSDMQLGESIPQQIAAAGGTVTKDINQADVILAINSPADGHMYDSTAPSNLFFASPANKRYLTRLRTYLDNSRNVSMADVAYSNGADNGFMNELSLRGLLTKLSAYNGWNTADNTIGFAVAQGMLAPQIKKEDQLQLMRERIIDDWYYQANARRTITNGLEKQHLEKHKYQLGSMGKDIHREAMQLMTRLAASYDLTKNTKFEITFPWDRLFEIDVVNIKDKPQGSKKK